MAIPVRNPSIRLFVLLLGIAPLWGLAVEPPEQAAEGAEPRIYGPIVPNDTLTEIAIKVKGDSPWHYHRWMYAIYLKNPDAFDGDNMNNLKMGARLKLPTAAELEQIELGEAFRVVKVHFYLLQQERHEEAEKQETNEDLLLRARLQRLFSANELIQKESGELFERIAALEQQVGSVVDQVLESKGAAVQSFPTEKAVAPAESRASQPPQTAGSVPAQSPPEEEGSMGWLLLLAIVVLLYLAGFLWRRRIEARL